MILRKPYKFFLKHFKLFHLILAGFFIYSLARISSVISFINSFTNSDVTLKTISMEDFNSLYSIMDFIVPILAIVLSLILLVVMTMKKKANKFYAYSVGVSLVVIIINIYGRDTMLDLTSTWLTKGQLETLVDIYVFVIIACIVEVAIALSRAIGFNISRFDFSSDIAKFETDEKDNEEFEVAVDFDINDVKRGIQKRSRYVKYFLKENRSTIIWCFAVLIGFLGAYGIYSFSKGRIKAENIKSLSYVNGVKFKVNDVYIIDKDTNGKELPDNLNLVIFDVIMENTSQKEVSFNPGVLSLTIGEDVYGRKTEYAKYVSDLGTLFYNEPLKKESTIQRLFVFAIPKSQRRQKMYFGVSGYGDTKYYKVKPQVIDTSDNIIAAKLTEELSMEGSSIGDTKFKINSFEIADQFEIKYTLNNTEYIKTIMHNYSGNNDNYILKLDGEFNFDKDSKIKDLGTLINKYGYIEYEIDGKQYKQTAGFREIKDSKITSNKTYYIEVKSDIASASKIVLGFRLRYADYKYYLKGSA